jgi:hypothetical protein
MSFAVSDFQPGTLSIIHSLVWWQACHPYSIHSLVWWQACHPYSIHSLVRWQACHPYSIHSLVWWQACQPYSIHSLVWWQACHPYSIQIFPGQILSFPHTYELSNKINPTKNFRSRDRNAFYLEENWVLNYHICIYPDVVSGILWITLNYIPLAKHPAVSSIFWK